MSKTLLPRVIEEPGPPPVASVVWLHGLGANGYDFLPIVPEVAPPADKTPTRFILPHASEIPVTLNGGVVMPAWHDADRSGGGFKVDKKTLAASQAAIAAIIQGEIDAGIPAERILIAGFSQGGALALTVGLTFPKTLAGILAMSTYLPHADLLTAERRAANAKTPLLLHHGSQDPVVTPEYAEQTQAKLKEWGHPHTFKSYPMAHSVCPDQVRDIKAWLGERLQAAAASDTSEVNAP